ncbi:MAG TPA: Arm DNA-binding domain-containing protein, partial [Mesorhizobium sp.]
MKTLTALTLPTFPVCEWPDNLTPGLLFRVGYRSKTWEVRTRKNGARQRVRVGYYPAMGLLDARNAAKEVLKRIE